MDRIETVREIDTDMSTDDRYSEDDEYRDETYAETYDEDAEACTTRTTIAGGTRV